MDLMEITTHLGTEEQCFVSAGRKILHSVMAVKIGRLQPESLAEATRQVFEVYTTAGTKRR